MRKEHDLIGELEINSDVYYGIQTQRGKNNFDYTGRKISRYSYFISSFAQVKKACALANVECKKLDKNLADYIGKACDDIIKGDFHEYFIVDPIQGGAGTSTNMNANEVIANRALELMGEKKGDYTKIHPNDHVNCSQSTNDSYPTSVKLGVVNYLEDVKESLSNLINALNKKAEEFSDVLKMGRTHLQDAVPMSVGQEFQAFSDVLKDDLTLIDITIEQLLIVNMGATAIGTGITSPKGYSEIVIRHLSEITNRNIKNSSNKIAATSDTTTFVFASSILKKISLKLIKISNDLRLLSSGPTTGIKEIDLPEVQPGSSIMPGKVNPVIPESVGQVAYQIIGNDLVLTMACENAQLQLNVFEPVMTYNLFESLIMITKAMDTLRIRCIDGIRVREDRCFDYVKNSVGIVTALNPVLGYEKVSAVAKESYKTGKPVYDVILEKGFLSKNDLDELLKPENMI